MSRLQSTLFLLGGALMVVGAGCFAFLYAQRVACWIYLVGAFVFAVMQVADNYDGPNLTIRRLKRIMTLADIMFVLSGILMVDTAYQFLRDVFSDAVAYYNAVYNKWVLMLLIAALLEMYTMHRMSSELKKSGEDNGGDANTGAAGE